MIPETRSPSQTRTESLLSAEVPVAERQQSLHSIHQEARPDHDTIAAVIPLLIDPDDSLRSMAALMLRQWGAQAVTMLLQALRATMPTDVPYRLAIIEQLRSMGPTAARAETLLRNLSSDPDVGKAAERAVSAIRQDGADLAQRVLLVSGELLLLTAVVAAPMLAIRQAAPAQAMPPLGLSIGIAALVIVGLMLARLAFADDLMVPRNEPEHAKPGRWVVYGVMAVGGGLMGLALGMINWACGGMIQGWFK